MNLLNPLAQVAQQQISAHIAAWAAIPVSLTETNPITYTNGAGLNLSDRLLAFTSQVRVHEASLLEPLRVSQSFLDDFMKRSNQYRLLFWQLPLPWIQSDRNIASALLQDMEGLGVSLRNLEKAMPSLRGDAHGPSHDGAAGDEAPLTVGREITYLRRLLASRASFAEELLLLSQAEPTEAVQIFYDENLRRLRRLDPMSSSLELYYSRRPSYRPPAVV